MFSFSYPFLVLYFSMLYSIIFLKLLTHNSLGDNRTWYQFKSFYIGMLLLLLVLPWAVYARSSPQNFRNPDIFAYMFDSEEILRLGHIPSVLKEDMYYVSFPVFTLLTSLLSLTSNLNSLHSVLLLNMIIQILFWLSIWTFIREISNRLLRLSHIAFGMVTVVYANPYLYGYFNTPLPQTMGLFIMLILYTIYIRLRILSISNLITYLILLIAGLVHITVIPSFLFMVFVLYLLNRITLRQGIQHGGIQHGQYRVLIPIAVFSIYITYTVALYPFSGYLQKVLGFINHVIVAAARGEVAITEGLPRGVLYPLNALGPALVIGATLSYIIMHLRAILKHEETDNELGAVALTSMVFITLGSLRQRFYVWGIAFFSISRYFNLPGYALATVVATWIVANALKHQKQRWLSILLIAVLILSAIGGLLDPLAFRSLNLNP